MTCVQVGFGEVADTLNAKRCMRHVMTHGLCKLACLVLSPRLEPPHDPYCLYGDDHSLQHQLESVDHVEHQRPMRVKQVHSQ